MRTLYIVLFWWLISFGSTANAQSELLSTLQNQIANAEYDAAQATLSQIESDASLAANPRTYYLKSFLYKDLFLSTSDENKPEYREKAIKSIEKGISLDTENKYVEPFKQLKEFVSSTYFNEGVEAFNNSNYEAAVEAFNDFLSRTNSLTNYSQDAHYYTGVAHYILGNHDAALKHYKILIDQDYDQALLYNDLANIYLSKNNMSEAKAMLGTGMARYPNSRDLAITELNFLSASQKYQEAEPKMDSYLASYPNDFDALLMAGTLYERNADLNPEMSEKYFQKAKSAYERAVQIKPNDYQANYNLGVTLYNRGVDLITAKSYDLELLEVKELVQRSSELFSSSLPYLEKSLSQRPEDVALLKALRGIYYNLNMEDKQANTQAKLEALGES